MTLRSMRCCDGQTIVVGSNETRSICTILARSHYPMYPKHVSMLVLLYCITLKLCIWPTAIRFGAVNEEYIVACNAISVKFSAYFLNSQKWHISRHHTPLV